MERLKRIEDVVAQILYAREDARENDDALYLCVCEHFYKGISAMTVSDFFKYRSEMGCPTFASVVRLRRKIFEKHPELKPVEATISRENMIPIYVDYALNG